MRVRTSQILIAGSELSSVDLFKNESRPMQVGVRRNGFGSQPDTASDGDCVSVTNISGPAAHVQLGDNAATVAPGETAFWVVYANSASSFKYRSEGAVSVLAIGTGRTMGRAAEMAAVGAAMMRGRG